MVTEKKIRFKDSYHFFISSIFLKLVKLKIWRGIYNENSPIILIKSVQ